MTSNRISSTSQSAVWWFIGATFLFIAPTLLFRTAPAWVMFLCLALGFIALVTGGIQLGREIRRRRDTKDAPSDQDDATG